MMLMMARDHLCFVGRRSMVIHHGRRKDMQHQRCSHQLLHHIHIIYLSFHCHLLGGRGVSRIELTWHRIQLQVSI